MTKAPIRNRMRAPSVWGLDLPDVASALSSQDQFVAQGRSSCVADRTVKLPSGAADLMVATDDLDEA